MVFPHLSLLVHFENSARENDLNSSLESIMYMFWSLKDEFQPVPTNFDSSTDLGHCVCTNFVHTLYILCTENIIITKPLLALLGLIRPYLASLATKVKMLKCLCNFQISCQNSMYRILKSVRPCFGCDSFGRV